MWGSVHGANTTPLWLSTFLMRGGAFSLVAQMPWISIVCYMKSGSPDNREVKQRGLEIQSL